MIVCWNICISVWCYLLNQTISNLSAAATITTIERNMNILNGALLGQSYVING